MNVFSICRFAVGHALRHTQPGSSRRAFILALAASGLLLVGHGGQAASPPPQMLRSFAFPAMFANGLTGDLVVPAGSTTGLRFEIGKVAIGELPLPLPDNARRRGRRPRGREFVRPADLGSHVRLLLTGVVDGDGRPVTNTGNEIVIDAVVSPSSAANGAPPFVIPFDITNGMAFVDALLPVQPTPDGSVRVQVLGVTVMDPGGQPFGVLGFQLKPARATPLPRATPTPGEAPPAEGQCFVGPDCTGGSFPASQVRCCRFASRLDGTPLAPAWCPPDQFDPSTGLCTGNACVPCAPTPESDLTPSGRPAGQHRSVR